MAGCNRDDMAESIWVYLAIYQGGENVKYTGSYNLAKPDPTDLVDISVINSNMDKIDKNMKSVETAAAKADRVVEITLYASRWVGSSAPYSQTVSVPGLKSTDIIRVMSAVTSSTPLSSIDTWEKMAYMVKFGIAQNGQAIFYCPKKKPTSDFKMKLVGVSST